MPVYLRGNVVVADDLLREVKSYYFLFSEAYETKVLVFEIPGPQLLLFDEAALKPQRSKRPGIEGRGGLGFALVEVVREQFNNLTEVRFNVFDHGSAEHYGETVVAKVVVFSYDLFPGWGAKLQMLQ